MTRTATLLHEAYLDISKRDALAFPNEAHFMALIGAGSVVTKDVPDGELWFGNPARRRGRAPPARRTGQTELPDI